MAITNSKQDLEFQKFVESTDTAGQAGIVVLNADGTAVGGSGGGDATAANQTTIIGHVDGIEGLLTTIDADTSAIKTAIEGTLTVDGSGVTQPVSGTVTANLSATDNAVLDSIDTAVNGTLTVDLGANNDVTTELTTDDLDTGAGTDTRAVVGLVGSASGGGELIPGSATNGLLVNLGSNNDVTVTNATAANLKVDGSDVTQPVSGTVTANLGATDNAVLDAIDSNTDFGAVVGGGAEATALRVTLANDSTGVVSVDDGGGALTVDGTVTANLSATDNAVLDNIQTSVDTVAAAVSTEMQVDVVGSLPAGTNAIGKLAANSGVDIGDVDVLSLPALAAGTNEIGSLLPPDTDVTAHTNYIRKYYTAATPTDGIIWSPAAGKRWHVTTMYINVSAASTVTLEDDKAGGDDPVWKGEIAANSGVVLQFPAQYPMASGEDAADLTITATAGTVYVTCVGYEI